MPEKKKVWVKVFLVDFKDVRAPAGFKPSFVDQLFFSSNPPSTAPSPDGSRFHGSLHQYVHASSDFWQSLAGSSTQWIKSNLRNRDIPHYRGSMRKPSGTGSTNWGESWPVIVAEALRGAGFTSNNYSSGAALRAAIRRLPNGRQADVLVFLNMDVAGGGAKRNFGQMKNSLDIMSDDRINNNTIPGSSQRWNALWDPAWAALPDLYCTPLMSANVGGHRADGTYPGPNPTKSSLEMNSLAVLWHEMGHLAVYNQKTWLDGGKGLPDFYGHAYGPWGRMCLMGGPKASTHYPMPLSSLARWMAGWLEFRDFSREDHRIRLRPFETHNDAVRLTNGAPGSDHYLILSNRDDLSYSAKGTPPSSKGRGVLTYRLDLRGQRLRVVRGGNVVRKVASIVRRDKNYNNMLWKAGKTIDALPPARGFFEGPRTLRNARGELWWTLDSISGDGRDLMVEPKLRAMHLLEDYHRAVWHGEKPGKRTVRVRLNPDDFGGSDGHVALQDRRMTVQGRGGKALYLHPAWATNGAVRGVYPLARLGGGPMRLYAKVGMPEEAKGSDGVELVFSSGSDTYTTRLHPGTHKEYCIDFRKPGSNLTVLARAKGSATRDWAYILDGWLVPAAPRHYDFLAQASKATWRTGSGKLTFNRQDQPTGEVSLRGWMRLHTGTYHGSKVLFTHPNWANNGWIEGTYPGDQVPANGAMIRAHLGWAHGRKVTNNGVRVSVSMTVGNKTTKLSTRPSTSSTRPTSARAGARTT
ncbi:hypothetical protein PPSIR1_18772 [Plesiocystis pacifica SIR-1]|uniref:Uncharacterized protein n=1 Tax=Plesiocystis pacifica SIR-1 TaxID=391625 RepID=A6GBH0_9BACT|nr:hypothetical protein [Plesiocystis pacifica]EDM76774.1 hypothetical protein PPSIR1_18772 [Plesiocystis pacifica SIR-1]